MRVNFPAHDSVYFWGDCNSNFGLGSKVTSPHKLNQRATHVEMGAGHAMLINNGEFFFISLKMI